MTRPMRGPLGMCEHQDDSGDRCGNLPGHTGRHGNIRGFWDPEPEPEPDRPARVPEQRRPPEGKTCRRGCCHL